VAAKLVDLFPTQLDCSAASQVARARLYLPRRVGAHSYSFTVLKSTSATSWPELVTPEAMPMEISLDRRAEDRFECHKRASVLFGGRVIDGILRSISLSGARLELPNPPFGLPPDLSLYLQDDETCYPIRIV
jgi:hypothetical protein